MPQRTKNLGTLVPRFPLLMHRKCSGAPAMIRSLFVATFLVGLCLSSSAARGHGKASQDIVDTAISAGSFKTLVRALEAAGLAEVLKSPGPFTMLAPNDEAFAALPKGTLEALFKDKQKL